jgi:PAS domain S-box-containing protein
MFARGSHAHEYRFQVADGSYLWFQDNVRLVRRADGSPDFLIGSWQDVTGRKLTEMALRANAERFRMLSQNSPLCVHEIDMGGKLQSMNPAGLAMMGLGREDIGKIIGLEYLSAVCADDTPRVEGLLQKAMSGEAGFFEFKSAGDAPRLFKSRLIPINDGSGAVIKLMGITEDVTEPRRMEEALRAAKDEAEKATLLKEKFVELVAHNLKSPFTSMLGQMKLLAAEKQTMDAAKKEEILRSAINGGEMMLRMIEELLDVTRLQTGQINPKLSFANLYSLTTGAAQTLGRLAEAKGILIVNKIPHKTRIWADPVLLTQVIHNLLANAIKFTPRGGAVTIIAMDGDTMRIVVRDTGVGIPPGTGAKLFSKEKPISTPGTEGETGAGLGLPLAMEIMKAHGGNLLVEPATGKGSVFCAELPIKRPTLLVVDDIPVERLLVRDRLKGTDVEILEASNGREALATLEKREIHLVICDVKMPIMDGLEFLAEVRNNPKLAKLPVILFTSGGKDVFDKALALGADDFVTKPVNQEELAARVRRFVA